MFLDAFPRVLILTGPTGSGKSRLAIDLAERLDAEIVSMDSMALYRRMDVGTAKPSADERRRVPHHLLDVLDPWESASVAWWLERAIACCHDISARGKRPLIVGGTPLYLKALLCGLFDGPPADETLRRRLSEEASTLGGPSLHARLAAIDPVSAARLHPNDLRRVIRALEVWELTGRPISTWQTQWRPSQESGVRNQESGIRSQESGAFPLTPDSCLLTPEAERLTPAAERCLCLDLPRVELYARIDARVERMIAEGLVEEVRALRQLERPLSREAAQALGYKEMFEHLDGQVSLEETVRRIQTRSRNFAKRQLTWFRRLSPCRPIAAELTFAAWGLTMRD
jgi:tRNA dimethylallyltransferase